MHPDHLTGPFDDTLANVSGARHIAVNRRRQAYAGGGNPLRTPDLDRELASPIVATINVGSPISNITYDDEIDQVVVLD